MNQITKRKKYYLEYQIIEWEGTGRIVWFELVTLQRNGRIKGDKTSKCMAELAFK